MIVKKAQRIRGELDRCRYRGDVSKCAVCRQEPERVVNQHGEPYTIMTTCQLYAAAGMGPTGRRKRIALLVFSLLGGLCFSQLVRWLAS